MAYCEWVTTTDPRTGRTITALVRFSGRAPRRCAACGKRSGTKLCDFKAAGKTCDKPLCGDCAISGGKGIDFCPSHPVTR